MDSDETSAALPSLEHLAEALRFLRHRRRLTQRDVEKRCGIRRSHLSSFEQGRSLPSLRTLWRLLGALGADLAELEREIRAVESSAGERS